MPVSYSRKIIVLFALNCEWYYKFKIVLMGFLSVYTYSIYTSITCKIHTYVQIDYMDAIQVNLH